MACIGNGGCAVLLCLGLFVAARSFCNCTEPMSIQTKITSLVRTPKTRDTSTLIQGQREGDGSTGVHHGRLLIGRNSVPSGKSKGIKSLKNLLGVHSDYQSDMGWEQPQFFKGQGEDSSRPDRAAVQRLLQTEPKVECTGESMRLQVQDADSTPGSLLFVDRGSRLSPLPISKLPSSCGYTLRSSRRDLVLVAPYDGCFVTLEEDSYVLPLRWWGLPVRMSCPVIKQPSSNPPMVTCHAEGMVVKIEWAVAVNKIMVKLNGIWQSLMKVSSRCGFSVVVHPEGVVISARYAPCVEIKDGMFTMELAGEGEIKVSCPSLPPLHPAKSPNQQIETPFLYTHSPHLVPSTHVPHHMPKLPPHPAIPMDPVHSQHPEKLTPTHAPKNISHPPQQPQEFYFPFHPNPFHPHPVKPGAPTMSVPSLITPAPPAMLEPTPERQIPLPLNPFPFYPWPAQTDDLHAGKEPAVQPQATKHPKGQEEPLYPYHFNVKPSNPDIHPGFPAQNPEVQPLPTTQPPVIQPPNNQIQQPCPHPFYSQEHETLPTQKPAKPFDSYPFYPLPWPPQKPAQSPVTQFGGHEHEFHPFKPQPPPASEAPQGQVQHPLYPLYPEPTKPETPEKPSPGAQVQHPLPPFPFYPQPPKQPASEAPDVPFNPNPFYPQSWPKGPSQKPVPPTQHSPNKIPCDQVQKPLHPLYPEAFKPEAPKNPTPGNLPAPGRQGQYAVYPFPFYTRPPKPPVSEAPLGQVHHPFYPYPVYPHPELEAHSTDKPASGAQSPNTEAPNSQAFQHFYPQPSQIPKSPELPIKKPDAEPPATNTPKGQVHQPSNQYYSYPQQPQNPQPLLSHGLNPQKPQPVTPANTQKLQEPANPQPSNSGLLPHPQPGTRYIPPIHCPQICPSGFSNCCPQIAFHQHHHHIVPAGFEGKGVLPVYPGLPFLPAFGYSSFGYGLESAPLPRKPAEPTKTSVGTSATSVLDDQHFDGHPAALPGELPVHPHLVPYDSQYLKWPYQAQDEKPPNYPQRLSSHHSDTPSKPPVAGGDPVKAWHDYEPYNIQPSKQQYGQLSSVMNNPTKPEPHMKPNVMPYIAQYLQQLQASVPQNKMTTKELQPHGKKSSDSTSPVHPQDQSESLNPSLIPYYMLQDSQVPFYNKSTGEPNSSSKRQLTLIDSKKSSKPEAQMHSYFEPNGYVLLQHGPSGRESSSFPDSLNDRSTFLEPKTIQDHSSKTQHPQDLKQPHGKPLYVKKMGKEMYYRSPGSHDHIPGLMGDKSTEGVPLYNSAPNGHLPASLPHEPFISPAHLRSKFPESSKDVWKPITPLGSNHRIPPRDRGHSSQNQGLAARQENGLSKEPLQREGGGSYTENK
ncbi:nascent polypeptide-associated complex subunit alpha, muscle-specific form-like isoform X2 [Myripristis murdjan]|uniref:Nascent polypeptide-associated complex subunit alpha, muscle-specific form-like n=1 Tax=Myripristis murdjan TaxID=586833 RepID=A0A667YCU5_9TELE|nr:nascent polypeptide-associated complex subunit alpha, muscle-specific form-like isoform X2 [Myripristis murdjan]